MERKVKVAKVFTHLTLGNVAEDFQLLYSVILAEGTNLGLAKMAQASSMGEVKKLIWLHEWYVREDTYLAARAELINFQLQQPLAQQWGEGTHSSSDGQHFNTAQKAQGLETFNHRHGREPGLIFYTHVSEQYNPFLSKSSLQPSGMPCTLWMASCTTRAIYALKNTPRTRTDCVLGQAPRWENGPVMPPRVDKPERTADLTDRGIN